MKKSCLYSAGFTLVEILTACAVVAALALSVFAAVRHAQGSSRSSACINNLRQLQSAVATYAHDHDNLIPPYQNVLSGMKYAGGPYVSVRYRPDILVGSLGPYARAESVWFCPADPLARQKRSGGHRSHYFSSYFTGKSLARTLGAGWNVGAAGTPMLSGITHRPPTEKDLQSASSSGSVLFAEDATSASVHAGKPNYTHTGAFSMPSFSTGTRSHSPAGATRSR